MITNLSKRLRHHASVLACAATVLLSLPAQADATTYRYGNGITATGVLPLELDFFEPAPTCTAPRPTVLLIHGGSFREGTRSDPPLRQLAEFLTTNGYNAASMDYRLMRDTPRPALTLAPDFQGHDAQLSAASAAFEDTAMAMRWLVDNAQILCVDPTQIILWGESAGAIAALYAAYALDTTSTKRPDPIAVVSFWGGFLPHNNLKRGDPALFLLHGSADITIPVDQSISLAKSAHSRGIPVHIHQVIDAGHGFDAIDPFQILLNDTPLTDHILRFLQAAQARRVFKSRATESQSPK